MNTPGFWEILFLAVLALLIFGPERLPGMARNVGRAIGQFKREANSTLDELKRTAEYEEFKGVAQEFRTTTADLKRSTTLTGPVASQARPEDTAGVGSTVSAGAEVTEPPPFDPDAT
jgi:sec-independent protein translocase protein TatB